MPLGNMSGVLSLGTILIILGIMLAVVMLFEHKTPGFGKAIPFYGILGVAMAAVGLAIVSLGL
ncbi:MAG: hypothetical protein ACYCOU_08400 [Sulfobacillus sp.]